MPTCGRTTSDNKRNPHFLRIVLQQAEHGEATTTQYVIDAMVILGLAIARGNRTYSLTTLGRYVSTKLNEVDHEDSSFLQREVEEVKSS